MGYYDPHPTLSLPRPVAITGFFGVGAGLVGGILSQRTGLPFSEIDRWIEHEAGRSLSAIALEKGLSTLRALEKKLVARALKQSPPAIISLGDGALLDDATLKAVLAGAETFYLRARTETLLDRVPDLVKTQPASLYPFVLGVPASEATIVPMLKAREPGYAACEHIIDVDALSLYEVTSRVLEVLHAQGAQAPA